MSEWRGGGMEESEEAETEWMNAHRGERKGWKTAHFTKWQD